MLRFAVLGRLEVHDGARVVDLGPARRVGVLAALLVDVGRVVPVDVLAERVWDGRPPTSATGTLQAHVSRLRAALGSASALRTTPTGYVLDVPTEAVDAGRFEAAVARAHDLAATGDREAAREEVTTALGLWSGRAYADVVADFATAEAARLDDVRLTAHELAAELDVATGHAGEAADRLGPIVAEHPFRERLRAALVVALVGTGRRAEALACLREGRRLLVDELGVEPGKRLRELQEAILADGADEGDGAGREAPDVAASVGTMVGRADELTAVVEVCRGAEAGVTGFAALRGEAGIGKTRLAEEVSARAAARGHVVAWGRCWRHEGSPALWPWIEVVRDLDRVTPPEVMAEALAGRGAPLTTVVPELVGDVPRPTGDVAEVRVFDAVLHVLGRLGEARPLLVVIDDAQWADPWSRRLLEYVAGHARDLRLSLLVTLRAGVDERGDLADPGLAVLAGLSRSGRLVAVELDGLAADDVGALVAARTGRALDALAAAALRERTDGNPFHVGEIARLVGDDDLGAVALPDTVRGVIGQRLAALASTDAEVLAVGAVVGRTFDLDLVAEVSGLDEDTVDDAVDRAVRAGLLRDEPTDEGDLRFTHALLAETLLDEIGPSRRRRLHRRIAATLAEQRRDPLGRRPTADRIARHHLAAGGDADLRTALDLLLEAADEALRRRSVPEVSRLLADASAAAERVGGSDGPAEAIRARQIAFDIVSRAPGELEDPTTAADTDRALDAADLLSVAYIRWTWPMNRGRTSTAVRLSDELMAVGQERDDDLLRFGALVMQATDRFVGGRFRGTRDACVEAETLMDRVEVPSLLFLPHPSLSIAFWRGMSLLVLGDAEQAREAHAEALRRAGASRDAVNDVYLASFDAYWWTFQRDAARTEQALGSARDAVARTGAGGLDYFLAMPEAWAVSHRDFDRGLELARAADQLISGPESLSFRPLFRVLHAEVLLLAEAPGDALAALDAGLRESNATGTHFVDVELHRLRACALRARGAPAAEIDVETALAREVAGEQEAVLFADRISGDG